MVYSTFIEVVGAHGVANHCWNILELRGALQKLTGHSLIQLCASGDNFTQDHLLKLRAEGIIHSLIGDHHSSRSQTYINDKKTQIRRTLCNAEEVFDLF